MSIRFVEMFEYNASRATEDLSRFANGTMSLNRMRRRWPKAVRSYVYKMERLGVDVARNRAAAAVRRYGV